MVFQLFAPFLFTPTLIFFFKVFFLNGEYKNRMKKKNKINFLNSLLFFFCMPLIFYADIFFWYTNGKYYQGKN